MNSKKHPLTATLCVLLLAGPILSISPAAAATITASPVSADSATFVLPAPPLLVPEATAVSSTVLETAWLQATNVDSILFLLPWNDKKDKKNKHNEDEGNWDDDRKDQEHDRDPGQRGSVSVQMVFGERDRQIIRDYCSQPASNLPPGLAKRGGQLPPGLEKHLRRNGQLPPGLQKKVERFPKELERRLPPLPRNYVRVFVGGRGLIVDAQFNIVDIIDIFR